jgi:hypothetical protein
MPICCLLAVVILAGGQHSRGVPGSAIAETVPARDASTFDVGVGGDSTIPLAATFEITRA